MQSVRLRLGQLLVDARIITQEQLDSVLAFQQDDGRRLGTLLVERGLINETQLTQILSQQLSVPWVSLYHVDFSRRLLNLVPPDVAEKYCLVPIYVRHVRGQGDTLYVAMDDPTNDEALNDCASWSGLPTRAMIASPSDIRHAIQVYYGIPKDRTSAPLVGRQSVPDASPSDSRTSGPAAKAYPASTSDIPEIEPESDAALPTPRTSPVPAQTLKGDAQAVQDEEEELTVRDRKVDLSGRSLAIVKPAPSADASVEVAADRVASNPPPHRPPMGSDAEIPVELVDEANRRSRPEIDAESAAPEPGRAKPPLSSDKQAEGSPHGAAPPASPTNEDGAQGEKRAARKQPYDDSTTLEIGGEIPLEQIVGEDKLRRLRQSLPELADLEDDDAAAGPSKGFAFTLLDGTTLPLPRPSSSRLGTPAPFPALRPEAISANPSSPPQSRGVQDGSDAGRGPRRRSLPPSLQEAPESLLTARDVVSALRAASHGVDASEILGPHARWESMVSTLLALLLRKGIITGEELIEELKRF